MAAVSRKRKRTALDIHQKQNIISYYDSKPKTSHQQIADHFSTLWFTEVKHRNKASITFCHDCEFVSRVYNCNYHDILITVT